MAAKNGAPIHITAFGNTAMPIRRDTCRYRLGQENATQQYQKDDEDFSHNGTVPQEPTGHERPSEVPNLGKQRSEFLSHSRRRNADDLWLHNVVLHKRVFFNPSGHLGLVELDCQQRTALRILQRPGEQEHPIVDPLFNPLLVSGHQLRGLRTIGPELEQDNVHENSLLLIAISELESVVYFCDAP